MDNKKNDTIHTRGTDGNGRTVWHGLGVSDYFFVFSFSFFGWAGAHDNNPRRKNTRKHATHPNSKPIANTLSIFTLPTYLLITWAESNNILY